MANIKDLTKSSDKWMRRAAVAGPDYESGIRNPRRPWAEASLGAEDNYKSGVVAAANAGRYGRGVKAAGNEKWQKNAIAKGPSRFAEGVALAQDAWETGFKPYQDAIRAITLPPRGPKGSPQNLQRVAAMANVLRKGSQARGGGA